MASYESQLTKKWQTSYPQQTKALLDSAAARLVKMDYLAPRAEKRLSWAFEANRRQIHVFYGVIVSGLTPGSWDWATYLSAKWSAEDQDSLDSPLLYRRYTAEK